ncbi:glutamine--fructose-6-phosphate transaminase (isomerizing) [Paracoccus yeei]|jgi:glucosamine--fructose-6-phosphate aminotransferase (isomerizing)|uniref:Glutamine--fructose-6-phosphate aminotransferase [isomerizing] n=1 Tax=Paracoccus yeei TaxID=147645 RepID=A0A1V0GUG3_9RHOB|nr:glutamine--fructose-6-phosphate transaminase (isomerizing) [Paracoccus yeei]ARC37493.1 glutamine--fructose-6-phosphate transaminase (isomerizing) [Paracoccus yeei]AYF00349.1 glutamine--fructose-6-phosphate aminotransferase [Paracoccus yeei]MBY0135404.1 glutamine--fructose-6-phosphate transaminase (isomerizing) [Paracoccus yeei]OWJ95208.1 glutamine--fructose-6-phosphate aminotransferase [Paracoccus yeei]
MCGIIGILGHHEVSPQLVEALKRLEYRGYDSAGVATVDASGRLDRRRAVGKLINLSDRLVHEPLTGHAGIGHTRWATHGAATEANAHPHRRGPVAVVHNGIIENFRALRDEVIALGMQPESQTDTETVALLTAWHMSQGLGPVEAARATLGRLHGAFALAFLFEGEADLMIAARRGSPLAIGHGDGEMFLGSDAVALAPFTDRITYLEDGDHAVIRRQGAEIFDAAGQRANRDLQQIDVGATQIDKGGFRHFMAKEIAEQPVVLGDALNHYVKGDRIVLPEALDFSAVDRLTLVGCGTAYYAAHVARYWFETLAGLPCDLDVASEFRYREPPLSPQSWALFVSQSGETADTLAALHYARDKVARTVGVVNVGTSAIARDADIALPTLAGIEVGVASSKAFTCQLAVLAVLALKAAQDRGRLDAAGLAAHLADLRALPGLLNQALAVSDECRRLAGWLSEAQDVLYLGRGPLYPVALEGALKLKELSYIHAEGYASGELKHGPIALIDRNVPVVVLAPRDGLFDKTVSNMQEVMARHGQVLLISDAEGVEKGGQGVHDSLTMPTGGGVFQPILYAVPMQYLAYHTAVAKGTDVDQPRNLAKSVTVE